MDYHEQLREAWRRESEYWQKVLPKYDESDERVYSISVWGGVLAALSLIGSGLLYYYPMPWLAFAASPSISFRDGLLTRGIGV
jgi:hypothetical protein